MDKQGYSEIGGVCVAGQSDAFLRFLFGQGETGRHDRSGQGLSTGHGHRRCRRRNPRVGYQGAVRAHLIGHPAQAHYLLAQDLSISGLLLLPQDPYPVHTRLLLDIEPDPVLEPIHALGEVAWISWDACQDRYRMGVHLLELDTDARGRLSTLVAARGQLTW